MGARDRAHEKRLGICSITTSLICMKYNELINGVKKFHKRFKDSKGEREVYPKHVSSGYINWDNIQHSDEEKNFYFLNTWGRCRLKCSQRVFLNGYKGLAHFLKPLKGLKFEEPDDLNALLKIGNEHMVAKRAIHYVFDRLMNIEGFGPVSTSKTLHLVAPGFLVMWDNAICQKYGLRLNGYNYSYIFMPS